MKEFQLKNVVVSKPGHSPLIYKTTGGKSGGDAHNPDGGNLSAKEKENIIDIGCTDTLINPDDESYFFGPDYPTQNVNYLRVLVRCPANCHTFKNIKVYGIGIHPQNTPICPAAIVDKAMSFYGGIISISIFPALKTYELPTDQEPLINNIKIRPYTSGDAKKSFVLAKVDNIDMVEKDIRIVDYKGTPTNEGRLEMRYEGIWGTICSQGNNRKSAKVICREVGYADGEWKSPKDQSGLGFCKSFKGYDHCGAETARLFLAQIKCDREDNKFHECDKILTEPNKCGHDSDAIIRCFNNDYEKAPQVAPLTIRLENYKTYGDKITGRLEMYYKNMWNPVCNIGFDQKAAFIGCRTMGYDSGKFIIHKTLNKFQLSSFSNRPFSATNIKCLGKEKALKKCGMKLDEVICKHDQDVVLICLGMKGDPSGKSQYFKKIPQPPPQLGKLTFPHRSVDCDIKGHDVMFRGDPGSIYIVTCPQVCEVRRGSIWGTGIYSSDSYVCKAAFHAGVIGDYGGQFAYIKSFKQKTYLESEQNGIISSQSSKQWNQSFSVSQLNTSWSSGYVQPSFLQKYDEAISFVDQFHSPIIMENSIETIENSIEPDEGYNYHYNKSLQKKLLLHSSFLEMKSNLIKKENVQLPVLAWLRPSYVYQFGPKSQFQIKKHLIEKSILDYTIIFQIKLTDFTHENTFILSSKNCGGYNIMITKEGTLTVGDYCEVNKFWNTGLRIPINDLITVYIRYSDSKISIVSTSNKLRIPYVKSKPFKLDITKDMFDSLERIYVGRDSMKDVGHFTGEIKFIHIYQGEFAKTSVNRLIANIGISGTPDYSQFQKTKDGRPCVSMCTDNPFPPNKGSGKPPKDADINGVFNYFALHAKGLNGHTAFGTHGANKNAVPHQNNFGGMSANNGHLSKYDLALQKDCGKKKNVDAGDSPYNGAYANIGKLKPGSTGTYNHAHKNDIETIKLTCTTNLLDNRFKGGPGKIFRANCPNCSNDSSMVFGTGIFHPLSSICRAALHNGSVKPNKGGDIHVLLVGKQKMFNGSVGSDNSNSGTFGASDNSFAISTAAPVTQLTCTTTANEGRFAGALVLSKFVANCPVNCALISNPKPIYGNDYYTDNSSICRAAIHRGVINDLGGEVKIVINGRKDQFKGTNGFGIISKDMGPHIRSFYFIGSKSASSYHFTEDCEGAISDNWAHGTENGVIHKLSDLWKFEKNLDGGKELGRKFTGISHEGDISVLGSQNKFASWIYLENAEWANGLVKFNFFLKDKNPISFFFRYKDRSNYYALKIDAKNDKIVLLSKIQSK